LEATDNTHEKFRVGDLEIDSGTFTLRRQGEEIALPKLSFELLHCLARHAPNVVSTQTLMDEVWGQVVVGEETVKQRVKLLRKALGDSSSDPRYIAAVRGRGYRLLAEVSPLVDEAGVAADGPVKSRSFKSWMAPIALLAAFAVGFLLLKQNDSPEAPVSHAGQEQPARSYTENPEALEAYQKGRVAYRRWTRQDNETALAFYERAYDLDPGFALAIAGAANAQALRATEFGLGEEWIDEAIILARQALELEPELPEALKALGISHVYKGQYQTALDYYRSALRLAPDYDEVLFNIAELLQFIGRWDEAVQYQQLDTDRPQGLERLSIYLRDLGFDEQAAALVSEFEQDLPVSFFTDGSLSLHYLLDGDYKQARMAVHRMQRAVPDLAGGWLREGEIDLLAGDRVSAEENFRAASETARGFEDYASLRLAHVKLLDGDTETARSLLKQVEDSALQAVSNGHEGWFHRWHLAAVYALLGEQNEALGWFEQAVDAGRRMFEWDEQEPAFQALGGELRFEAALQRQRDLRREMKRNTAVLLGEEVPAPAADEPASVVPGPLPEPVANNAVAEYSKDGLQYVMSFMGLGPGKGHGDISKKAWLWRSDTAAWEPFPEVPVEQGRLAAVAVGLYDRVLLFGGYTVAPDGTEKSTPEVFIINPLNGSYQRRADMPVPVDDAVAFAYANRYIYLVSGWHDEGNVDHVQVYDTWEDTWAMADAFPGTPVFGHAGGIVGQQFVIVGGVGVLGMKDGKRQFGAINQAWQGEIDSDDPTKISWSELPLLDETAQYRMAATGDESSGLVLFAGGSRRPYNFNGIGYDGLPAEPENSFFGWDITGGAWVWFPDVSRDATMDHRGLLKIGNAGFITLGGMTAGQVVTGSLVRVELPLQFR
jgi:DNA-binding winged helix-turn-helix (wHTH) protein/tetratricopeptide (TPR) repeat protein